MRLLICWCESGGFGTEGSLFQCLNPTDHDDEDGGDTDDGFDDEDDGVAFQELNSSHYITFFLIMGLLYFW